jgi:hypothetical protein
MQRRTYNLVIPTRCFRGPFPTIAFQYINENKFNEESPRLERIGSLKIAPTVGEARAYATAIPGNHRRQFCARLAESHLYAQSGEQIDKDIHGYYCQACHDESEVKAVAR